MTMAIVEIIGLYMKFRSGKYAGLTIDHVRTIAPWYIKWVKENRPEMLKEHKFIPKAKKTNNTVRFEPFAGLKPCYDFDTTNK